MTFLSQQNFDADGKIQVVKKKRRILNMDSVEQQEDGTIKGKAEIKIEYGELSRDNMKDVDNLVAAEEYVLEEGNVFWGMGTPPLNHIKPEARLAHRIGNARANISNFSKRGMGNTIVYHPSVEDKVQEALTAMKIVKVPANPLDPECEDMVEQEQPYFKEGEMELFPHDAAPEEKVLVMYRGAGDEDQPLIYVDGEGLLFNSTVADVETYGKFVRIP